MAVTDCCSVTGVLGVGVVSLLIYWFWRSNQVYKTFDQMGVKGPTPSYFVGNLRHMSKKGFCDAFVEWKKKYGDVYGMYMAKSPMFVVSDLDLLRDIMVKQFPNYKNRIPQKVMQYKPWEDNLLQLRDDHWKHVRSQLSPTFSSGKLKKMMPAISRVIENLDKHVAKMAESGEEVELKHLAGCFAMDSIAGAAFGIQVDTVANPKDPFNVNATNILTQRMWLLPILLMFPTLASWLRPLGISFISKSSTDFFMNLIRMALKERRMDTKTYSDFLQLLVEVEKSGVSGGPVDAEIDHADQLTTSTKWTAKGMNDEEIQANALIFLLAGYDTTSIVMSFTLFHLAANPKALAKAQQEIDNKVGKNKVTYELAGELTYLDMCMNEAIRLQPPGFMIDRQASEATELAGYPVEKGMRIVIPVYAIHHDPDLYPDPETFDPERHSPEAKSARHPFAFLPFGMGPRNCIGMRLAQLEIRMVLATLLQHYTPILCDKSVYPPVITPPQTRITAKDGLWVKFKLRE